VYHPTFDYWSGFVILDAEFRRQRAETVRELAQITTDPFIKQRLIKLVARYEDVMSLLALYSLRVT
jgi:hypothetical protein